MKTLLAEQPWVLALLVGVLAVTFLYGWLQSGKRIAGVAGVVALALIPLLFYIASVWQTEREIIQDLVYETAEAVQANDIDKAVRVIGSQQPALVARAKAELSNYVFSVAKVSKLQSIDVDELSLPMQAEVELMAVVRVSSKNGQIADLQIPRRLSLRFEKQSDGKWVVTDYDHGPPLGERDGYSP